MEVLPSERKGALISIIIPVYNVEQYLPNCLSSIAEQTYKHFEAILVDDGATDLSGTICEKYSLNDSRFRVIHQENQGLSSARNTGLKVAKGEYISFIDGDDYIHPQMIETLYNAAIETGCKVSMINGKIVKHYSSPEGEVAKKLQIINQDTLVNNLFNPPHDDLLFKYSYVWNKLYHKSIIEGLSFNNALCEDMDFNIRVFLKIDKLAFVDTRLYYYFQRESSLTQSKRSFRIIDLIPEYENLYNHIPSKYPTYQSYCVKRTIKLILHRREAVKKTEFESYTKKRLQRIEKVSTKFLWENPIISIFDKIVFTFIIKTPITYDIFKWILEKKAKIGQRYLIFRHYLF